MADTVSQIGARGLEVHPAYVACVLSVDGYPNAAYANDYLYTFGTTGQPSHFLGDTTKDPQGQTYITLNWRNSGTCGLILRIEHQYVWQREVYVLAHTMLPIRNISDTPTIRTFASGNPMAPLVGTTEYSQISFDIDSEDCMHWIDRESVNRLERHGHREAVEIQKASSAPFWYDDEEGMRSISILLWVHSPEAMIFKDDFMTVWNQLRKDLITDVLMSPRSHPFLPPADTSLIDTIVKNSLPEDTPYYTSREPDDEIKTRRAHIIACLIEHDKKKVTSKA
ncbi:hypothetical protein FOQG_17875 [Fusarium oxysporum f. sp. raphani 54005]|uniref:Uncharacterized protein n=3 Tax=Fusarium TaxID=5506 RepID=X0B5L8_FUSOX|nr:hypothetical protein FOQG_17875 [Fusarium oxysporum f. sp. raphani 54005]KAF5702954.1 hypothetical protein FGLOB1_9327 [Fusarium globosum]KAG7423362.1 hypothetical protein Forpi1262_v015192 [Fusarium oxysporum f. sp. raphani]